MTARLVAPQEAGERVARVLRRSWAELVCSELTDPVAHQLEVPLAPGVRSGTDVARLGFGVTHAWAQAWRDLTAAGIVGGAVRTRPVSVERLVQDLPATLVIRGLEGALAFVRQTGVEAPVGEVERGRRVAGALVACGTRLGPATLRAASRLSDADLEGLTGAVRWLQDHTDVSAWTARQLPVPGIHSKWLEQHGALLRDLVGRDVRLEVRPRLAVVHLTYVDPSYLAAGGRRHDAWTTGDVHEPAYQPSIVLVVENRDCRLWFPPLDGTVVVEGGGKAAATLLADVPWIRRSRSIVYWGDVDADGFAILDRFRAAMALPADDGSPARGVDSLLMDADALDRYGHLGGDRDRSGRPIAPSSTDLRHLTAPEASAYYTIATRGSVAVRRIEQERIPIDDAVSALVGLSTRSGR